MPESKKKKKTCQYESGDYKCPRKLHDKEHCIFHSQDIEGKKDKFRNAFGKEFDRQKEEEKEYNFVGFVFPGDISFRRKIIEKDVNFSSAQFSGETDFSYTRFFKKASFRDAQFFGKANFWGAQFSGKADFSYTEFSGKTKISFAKFFVEADFRDAQFSGETDFSYTRFSDKAYFSRTKFLKLADFEGIIIKRPNSFKMPDTYFYDVTGLFESIEKHKDKFTYSNKTEFLPDGFKLILGESATARYPIFSRNIKDDMYLLSFKNKFPKLHFLWWLFADCGRSFLRWALWSILFAVLFAFGYYFMGPESFYILHLPQTSFLTMLYYSIVTFTTLGFGDITPTTPGASILVMAEVILGYVMLGGLISIFANKLARRS